MCGAARARVAVSAVLVLLACNDVTESRLFGGTVVVSPADSVLPQSGTLQMTAVVRDAAGEVVSLPLEWSSSDTLVARVSQSGLVSALDSGSVVITARLDTVSASASLRITRSATIALRDLAPSLNLGQHDTASALVRTFTGATITDAAIEWSVSDSGVLTVDSVGIVRGVGTGTAYVRATVEGRTDSLPSTVAMIAISMPSPFVALAKGWFHACGLDESGLAYCWGDNTHGQLGTGQTGSETQPAAVSGGRAHVSITAGQQNTCALAADSTAWCWGQNVDAELGQGTRTPTRSNVPIMVQWPKMLAVESGDHKAQCGISAADSLLICWGHNDTWQLGRPPKSVRDSVLGPTGDSLKAVQVSLGPFSGCALDTSRHPWCWGHNVDSVPFLVDATRQYVLVAVGFEPSCAIASAGETYCWGYNSYGALGAGLPPDDMTFHRTPLLVAGGHSFVTLAGSFGYTCGITSDARLYCWGQNRLAAHGNQKRGTSNVPIELFPELRFRAIATGLDMCGITTDDRLYCW